MRCGQLCFTRWCIVSFWVILCPPSLPHQSGANRPFAIGRTVWGHLALVLNSLPGPLTILYFIPPTNQVAGTSQKTPFSTNQAIRSLGEVLGFPGGSDSKESACSAGDPGSVPRLGRSPGEGNGYPLQYSCLESSMDRGALQAAVHWAAKSRTWLNDFHFQFFFQCH